MPTKSKVRRIVTGIAAAKTRKNSETRSNHTSAGAETVWACVVAILIACLYADSPSLHLWLVLAVVPGVLLLPRTRLGMRAVDWGILLVCAFEIPSLLFSQYRANGIRSSWAVAIAVLVYFAVRFTIRKPIQTACLSGVLGLGGAWLALSGWRQFADNARLLSESGFSNMVAFRSQLISPPRPWIPGEWFTILLLTLPFACALPAYLLQRQQKWPAVLATLGPILISATLFLSLSRAVFWSTVLFCMVVCALLVVSRVITLRAGGTLLCSAMLTLILILACESATYPGIFQAYAGRHMSQVRSTEGRIAIWHRSLELVRAHPLWGVGSANAALALTSTTDQNETTGFASRTFSLPLQVLIEKGFIGFLLYATFLALVAREFILTMRSPARPPTDAPPHDPQHGPNQSSDRLELAVSANQFANKAMTCCFAAGLVAVLFRELVYSSLLEHTLTLVLAAALSALMWLPERGT